MQLRSMTVALIPLALAITCWSPASAESGGVGSAPAANNAFSDLNKTFIKNYSAIAAKNLKATRPILITTGAQFQLLCEDGSVKVAPPGNVVENQLKSVSHVCAYLYAVSDSHWRDPDSIAWKQSLTEAQQKFEAALAEVDKVSWSSDAWPDGESKLKEFVRQSLSLARDFSVSALKKGDITREDFQEFATKYTPTIRSTFYLNSLSNAYDTLKVLKQWRQDVGEEAWSRMKVIIAAGKGRSTAGLTAETNPAAVIMASVMDPTKVKTNLLMSPGAATTEEALDGQALALTSYKLADAFKGNSDAEWFYTSLKQPDIPVALEPVRSAVSDLEKGTAKDPILGLGPKK